MSVGKTALRLAPIAFVSRAAAFLVPVVIASWFGVNAATDAFYYALSIPSFLIVLGGNAMGTVLVPTLARLFARRTGEMARVAGAGAIAGAAVATAIGMAFTLSLPFVLPRVTRFDAPTQELTVRFAVMLLPFLAAVGMAAVARAACEVQGLFVPAAMAPLVRAGAQLGVTWFFRELGADVLPLGMCAGALGEVVWLGTFAARGGGFAFALGLPAELAEAGRAFAPVLLGEAMVAMNVVVDKAFASLLPAGSVSLLEYADRARLIPQTLLETSLLVVAFNAWAAARARDEDRADAIASALRWVWLLAPPVLAGMFLGREVIVRVLFERGAFLPEFTAPCADTLGVFVPGLFGSLLGALVMRAHIVEGRFGLVLRLGLLSLVLNASLNAVLLRFGLPGLALSTTITTITVTAVSSWRLGISLPADGVVLAGLALLVAAIPLRPTSLFAPELWLLSVPCFVLLGVGAWRARRGG